MANRTGKGVSAAEFLRILERRERKLGVKKTLSTDPFETRMYENELQKVQRMIKALRRMTNHCKTSGVEISMSGAPVEAAVLVKTRK